MLFRAAICGFGTDIFRLWPVFNSEKMQLLIHFDMMFYQIEANFMENIGWVARRFFLLDPSEHSPKNGRKHEAGL